MKLSEEADAEDEDAKKDLMPVSRAGGETLSRSHDAASSGGGALGIDVHPRHGRFALPRVARSPRADAEERRGSTLRAGRSHPGKQRASSAGYRDGKDAAPNALLRALP